MKIKPNLSEFKTGFCDCCDNVPDCLLGYFCPCIIAGMTSDQAGIRFNFFKILLIIKW